MISERMWWTCAVKRMNEIIAEEGVRWFDVLRRSERRGLARTRSRMPGQEIPRRPEHR